MMTKGTRVSNLVLLHVIVFIWGFTGILGYEISLESVPIVWWRTLIAFVALGAYGFFFRKSLKVDKSQLLRFAVVGLLTAAHWIFFFESIKVSTISVALVVLSTTSFFISLIGPFIRKEKFRPAEVLLGAIAIIGLAVIFKFESEYTLGIVYSLIAALLAALFSTFNSTLVKETPPLKIAFWEMLFAFLGVTIFVLIKGGIDLQLTTIDLYDFGLLLILGIVCTAFGFVAGIHVLKVLSPFTCALTINLEPIYTIVFALLFYGEREFMSPQFYLGAVIILSTLFIEAWVHNRK